MTFARDGRTLELRWPAPPRKDLERVAGNVYRYPGTNDFTAYQLGAKVAGAVACAWIERGGKEAREALAGSRNWPVLLEMNAEGDYPEVVWQYADDPPKGYVGYKQALGC